MVLFLLPDEGLWRFHRPNYIVVRTPPWGNLSYFPLFYYLYQSYLFTLHFLYPLFAHFFNIIKKPMNIPYYPVIHHRHFLMIFYKGKSFLLNLITPTVYVTPAITSSIAHFHRNVRVPSIIDIVSNKDIIDT